MRENWINKPEFNVKKSRKDVISFLIKVKNRKRFFLVEINEKCRYDCTSVSNFISIEKEK